MKNNIRTYLISLVFALLGFQTSMGQENSIDFSAVAMNVDGLPAKILFVTVNGDGPGSEGTKLISQKIAERGWDFIGCSEDFENDAELRSALTTNYNFGTYRKPGNWTSALTGKLDTDGLQFIWKNTHKATNETFVEWTEKYGGLTDGANTCLEKGYRYYTLTLANGFEVDMYILHMDAGTGDDANGIKHGQTVQKQWTQLVTAIKGTNNKRPIIVMGDTNCRYTRIESPKTNFIDQMNEDSRFEVHDGWIEKCKGGNYPNVGDPALTVGDLGYVEGEIVDKVFYINNTDADVELVLNDWYADTQFVKADGKPLADHFPVVGMFTARLKDNSGTTDPENPGTVDPEDPDPENPETPDTPDAPSLDCSSKWAWTGEAYDAADKTWYLYALGRKQFLAKNETTVTDINDANVVAWTLTHSAVDQAGEVKYEEGSTTYNMWMGYSSFNYKAGINTKAPWTSWGSSSTNSLTIKKGSNDNSYSFGYQRSGYHYFQAQESGIFKGGDTNDQWSDWYLVSPAQKELYDQYMKDLKIVAELNLAGIPNDTYQTLTEYVENTMNMSRQPKFHDFITQLYYDATITTADYSTLCLPFNAAVPEDVKVYYGSAFSEGGTTLILKEMNGDVLPANTGVVLYADVDANTTFRFWKTQEEVADNQPENLLIGTNTRIEASERDNSYLYYALTNMTTGVGFHEIDETKNVAIPAHRAYLQIEKTNVTASNAFLFSLDNDSLTTDITSVNHGEKNCETIFNLNGIRTNRLQQGVNIIRTADGAVRKVIVK